MKIEIKKTIDIKNINQWFNVAPPEGGEKQWVEGRSAMEMARLALSRRFPELICQVLKECEIKDDYFLCEPEALTPFEKGMGNSGPRHHDLLMIGKDTIIGIEAKVSEPFDKKIKDKRFGASDNMCRRLDSCIDYLYKNKPDNVEDLYYQLFSATVGSIIEAKKHEKKNVVSLFIVFDGDVLKEPQYEDKVKENEKAFKAFCQSFGLDETGGKIPNIPKAIDVNCWIKKIKIHIDNYSFSQNK